MTTKQDADREIVISRVISASRELVFEAFREGDGRAWLHWTFERGPRHCGTWNAEPFMLENGGSPGTEPLTA